MDGAAVACGFPEVAVFCAVAMDFAAGPAMLEVPTAGTCAVNTKWKATARSWAAANNARTVQAAAIVLSERMAEGM